jgi:hypothetical protein
MCTEIWFAHEKREATCLNELIEILGGSETIRAHPGYGGRRGLLKNPEHCLCGLDVERTFKGSPYDLKYDCVYYTATLDPDEVERRNHAADLARYEAAMAEMRSPTPAETPRPAQEAMT